jgi:hypothetical protein
MPGEGEPDRIILCESRVQAGELVRRGCTHDTGVQIIAANPDTGWFLRERGVPFTPIDVFHRNRSPGEVEDLLMEQFRWAGETDRLLQESVPEFGDADFRPARYFLCFLKNPWDTCIHRAEVLDHLARESHPRLVSYWKAPGTMGFDQGLTPRGSVLSACVHPWAGYHGIREDPSPAFPDDGFWELQNDVTSPGRLFMRLLFSKLPPRAAYRILSWRNGGTGPERGRQEKGTDAGPPIIARRQYDITGEVCSRIRGAGFPLIPFESVLADLRTDRGREEVSPGLLTRAWETAVTEDWFWKPGGWQEWSLRPLLEPLFWHFWFSAIPAIWKSARAAASVFGRSRPGGLVTGIISGPDETGLVMAARHEGIPVVFYTHGANMGDIANLAWDVLDRVYGDVMLVYGPGPSAYIRSRPPLPGGAATPVPVGSARLDANRDRPDPSRIRDIRQRIAGDPEKPVVLYVPGVLFTNYFRYDHFDMRPFRFFQARRDMARLLHEHREVQFAYKAFISWGRDPTLEMLGKVCPGCRIVRDIPLPELQWACDLLLHEIPSTGMYEGLMTDRHLAVYVDGEIFRMDHGAAGLLGLRASVARDPAEFIRMAGEALEGGCLLRPAPGDRSFLREYCTHLDDGASAARAAGEIGRIARGLGTRASPGF